MSPKGLNRGSHVDRAIYAGADVLTDGIDAISRVSQRVAGFVATAATEALNIGQGAVDHAKIATTGLMKNVLGRK